MPSKTQLLVTEINDIILILKIQNSHFPSSTHIYEGIIAQIFIIILAYLQAIKCAVFSLVIKYAINVNLREKSHSFIQYINRKNKQHIQQSFLLYIL